MSQKRKAANSLNVSKKSIFWTDRELVNLAAALQFYGFGETKKIAEALKSKDEITLKYFLETEVSKLRQRFVHQTHRPGRKNYKSLWYHPDSNNLKEWPAPRVWRRVVFDQLLPCVRKNDYSKLLMQDLLETFYKEAEEVDDPQVINVKAIYKYLLDCVTGVTPAELSPINSGVVLMLLGQLKEMQRDLDFDEELTFIKTFKRAKLFAPIKVKDEHRERAKKRSEELQNSASPGEFSAPSCSSSHSDNDNGDDDDEEEDKRDTIKVVEDMYINLTKHRKLVQSLNPLNVPMWTLVKEQGYVQNKCDLSPRLPSK